MKEVIMMLVGDIKALEEKMKGLRPEFEAFISDKSIPLEQRWQTWVDAPDSLKNTGGWIDDGRLEAFKLLGYGGRHNEAIAHEGGLVWAERYERIDMVDILETILENLVDKFNVEIPDDFDWDDVDGYKEVSPEIHDFLSAYREELLEKNLKSFRFDW